MHTPDYTITPEFRDGDLMYVARVAGREVGAAYSYVGAEELAAPRYELMLDVSAGDPEEQDGPSEEGGEGGPSEPPDIYRRVPDGECASCYHFGPRVDDGEAYVCADFDMCCERGRADTWSRSLAGHVAREYTAFLAAAPDSPAPSPLPTAPAGGDAANAAGPKARYLERAQAARLAWEAREPGITVAIRHQGRIVAYHPSAYVAHLAAERLREVA